MRSYNSHEKFPKFPLPFIVLLLFSPLFLHFASAKYSPETSSSGGDALDTTNVTPSMAMIIIILVFAFFVTGCVSIYLQQCADPSPPSSSSPIVFSGTGEVHPAMVNLTRGLETSVIESFPTFVYSSVKDLKLRKGSLECAVCLSEFRDDEILRLLPKCDHVFHYDCIDAWLVGHTTCPVCRANLVPDSDQNGKSNESTQEIDSGSDLQSSSSGEVRITIIDGDFRKKRLPKSHSTGHSLSRLGEDSCSERFTLRLPVEVRRQLMDRTKLKRETSMVALPRESSSRWPYRDCGGGDGGGILAFSTDWWSSVRMTGKAKLMEM